MSTSIFLASVILGFCINPEYMGSISQETIDFLGWAFTGFIIYDVLTAGSKK